MSLDVFDPTPVLQNAQQNLARDLPADFTEAFDVATRSIGEWNSSVAYGNARDRALASYYDDVKQNTGVQLPLYGMGGNVSLDELNSAIGKLPQAPDQPERTYTPLSEGSIDAMTLQRMAKAHDDAAAFGRRETSWSGTAGTVLGTLAASLSDPVTVATLPLGGAGEAGIGLRALEFAGIGGGTEAAIAATNFQSHEAAVPGSSKEIPGEILGATASGAVLGGAFGVLGRLLGHGAKPLPTSVRDDVNAATSEFQFNATNPFPTAAGDAAARDATIGATTSLAKGETVTAADDIAARHVADYALAARADSPEALALAGEQHLRPETFGETPDVERFDRMPSESDDVASYWDKRLEGASAEERHALGATDERISFTTAKGSTYEVAEDGTTIRNKAARSDIGHEGDSGIKTQSARTIYVDPQVASELSGAGLQSLGPKGFRVAIKDGRAYGLTWNEAAGQWGASPGGRDIPFTTKPEVGRSPVELWKPSTDVPGYDAYRGQHAGNAITEVRGQVEPIAPRDLTPEQVTHLADEPATQDAVLHNLDHIAQANPEMEFTTQIRQPDGSYSFVTQKLSDVMGELDGWEAAAKEIEACAVGGALEAAE